MGFIQLGDVLDVLANVFENALVGVTPGFVQRGVQDVFTGNFSLLLGKLRRLIQYSTDLLQACVANVVQLLVRFLIFLERLNARGVVSHVANVTRKEQPQAAGEQPVRQVLCKRTDVRRKLSDVAIDKLLSLDGQPSVLGDFFAASLAF